MCVRLQGVAAHAGAHMSGVRLACIACDVLGVEARGGSELSLRGCIFRNILKHKQSSSTDVNSTCIMVQSRSTAEIVGTKTRNCGVGLVLRRAVVVASECQFVAGNVNCAHVYQQSRLSIKDSVLAESLEGNGLLVSGENSSADVGKCRCELHAACSFRTDKSFRLSHLEQHTRALGTCCVVSSTVTGLSVCSFVKNKGAGVCVAKLSKVVVVGCLASQNGTCGTTFLYLHAACCFACALGYTLGVHCTMHEQHACGSHA